MSLEHLFATVLMANLIGFGGLSSLPVMRGELETAGLQADSLLLHSLAVANITPGPNGLYLVVVGYFVADIQGALVAILALLLPPVLVLPLEKARSRLLHLKRFRAAMFALSLSVVALLAISSGSLVLHSATDTLGFAMVCAGTVLLLCRAPPILGFVLALTVGWLVS
ncbi:MAG TPA: chromate transporter [Rhodanobacter sp.]